LRLVEVFHKTRDYLMSKIQASKRKWPMAIAALLAVFDLLTLASCSRTKPNPQVEKVVKTLSEGDTFHDIVIIKSVPNRFLGRMEAIATEGDKEMLTEPAYLGTVFPNMIEMRNGKQLPIIGVLQAKNKDGTENTILVAEGILHFFWDTGPQGEAIGARTGLLVIDGSGGNVKLLLR
jgi:hypothetical protein